MGESIKEIHNCRICGVEAVFDARKPTPKDSRKFICNNCFPKLEAEIESRLRKLGVEIVKCVACGKEMIWLKGKSGKSLPVCLNLINHFSDCPKAEEFRQAKEYKKFLG